MSMYDTQTIEIASDPVRVQAFIRDGANLPRWAIGFAKGAQLNGEQWIVTTGAGDRIPTVIVSSATAGTVDFVMSPAPSVTVTAWSRVVAANGGTLFTFTQVQPDGMPDEVFAGQVRALSHELVALKALLEVECPL
ncbi:MAG TPA: hypothetical protein VNO51_23220 [Ilumatobacteraceae bacterium]|nr:hypothetical protein [Ilumatobacteraceae bacterium]